MVQAGIDFFPRKKSIQFLLGISHIKKIIRVLSTAFLSKNIVLAKIYWYPVRYCIDSYLTNCNSLYFGGFFFRLFLCCKTFLGWVGVGGWSGVISILPPWGLELPNLQPLDSFG